MRNIPLVSVVIPAFNASKTLHETLVSVASQTYSNLEIIVVDDGSVDDTGEIINGFIQTDSRVRCIRKSNGGVASARNAGVRACSGEFVAFIDADDLWHPTKTAKQMDVLLAGGEDMALVYSPFRLIDTNSMVVGISRNFRAEGWVANRHFCVNIIGNGSSILVRKRVLEEVGGYSLALREVNAQGCEDLLLQLRIALRYRFGTVPEYLVGYRQSPGNMSSDNERMLRSGLLSIAYALAECPNFAELPERGLLGWTTWEYLKATIQRGRLRAGMSLIWPQLQQHPSLVVKAIWKDVLSKTRGVSRRLKATPSRFPRSSGAPLRHHFYDYHPAEKLIGGHIPGREDEETHDDLWRNLRELASLDAQYRPEKYFSGQVPVASSVPIALTSMAVGGAPGSAVSRKKQ